MIFFLKFPQWKFLGIVLLHSIHLFYSEIKNCLKYLISNQIDHCLIYMILGTIPRAFGSGTQGPQSNSVMQVTLQISVKIDKIIVLNLYYTKCWLFLLTLYNTHPTTLFLFYLACSVLLLAKFDHNSYAGLFIAIFW